MTKLERYLKAKKEMLDALERERNQMNVLLQMHGPINLDLSVDCVICNVIWPCEPFLEIENKYAHTT